MKRYLKQIAKSTGLYDPLMRWTRHRRSRRELVRWERYGRPVPPPHVVKQKALRALAREYGLKTLVETGTFHGDMIDAMQNDFNSIVSIELSVPLYERAIERFRGVPNVTLLCGDSSVELRNLMATIDEPILFWLDGHYSAGETARGSKDTPIYEELNHIFDAKYQPHVIAIDDARLFGTDPGYPTIADFVAFVNSKSNAVDIAIFDDIIRITPQRDHNS